MRGVGGRGYGVGGTGVPRGEECRWSETRESKVNIF
jgi:hypothetical protein